MTGTRWSRLESLLAEDARKQAERRELSTKYRWVIAERMGWPLGYVQECDKLDEEFPDYHSSYFARTAGWSKPGWYATPWRSHNGEPRTHYGATVGDLRSALQAVIDRE